MLVRPAEVPLAVIALILLHLCLLSAQLDPITLPDHVFQYFHHFHHYFHHPPTGVSGFCIFLPLTVHDH